MEKRKCLAIMSTIFILLFAGCQDSREALFPQDANVSDGVWEPDGDTQTQEEQETKEASQAQEFDQTQETEESEDSGAYDFTICFAGDVSLAEDAVTTKRLDKNEGDLSTCISPELIARMQAADLMCLNNEFTYSLRGKPMSGKAYTFRAAPERVNVLLELGVDLAGLANNHVYDYGEDAFLDTLDTLEEAGIAYVGAGRNLAEAMEPYYVEMDGKTVAFVAASRAEKYKLTPQAMEDAPGILRCYDTELFLQEIRQARDNADFVIALVHWGTEYSYELETVQKTTAREYLDAGADVIIGSHSHCLQGMEYYDGKPILYSLGNYWFNAKTLDTMLVECRFWGDQDKQMLAVTVIPAIQKNSSTIIAGADDRERIFDFLERISVNVEIDETGEVGMLSENGCQ